MPVPATTNGSPDVIGKEQTVTRPELIKQDQRHAPVSGSWREAVQCAADGTQIEGSALEYLIDFQRDRARSVGEGR